MSNLTGHEPGLIDTYAEVWKEFQFFVGGTSSTWYCSQCLLQVLWMQKGMSNIHTHIWYTNHESTSHKQSKTRRNKQSKAQPSAWRYMAWFHLSCPKTTTECERKCAHVIPHILSESFLSADESQHVSTYMMVHPWETMRDHAFLHCCIRTCLILWPCLIMNSDITMPCLDQLGFALSSHNTWRRPDQSWSDCAVGDCVGEPMPTTTGAACSNTKADSRVEPATCILSFKIPARVHSVSIVNTERNRG